jgi:hypothetical protein
MRFASALLSRAAPLHLGQDAEEILHVVPDFVGDHIGLR